VQLPGLADDRDDRRFRFQQLAQVEIIRGGDVISYLGFNVGLRPWVEKNGDTVEKYLAALAEADQWMRKNPKQAAQVATRWIPGKSCRCCVKRA